MKSYSCDIPPEFGASSEQNSKNPKWRPFLLKIGENPLSTCSMSLATVGPLPPHTCKACLN
jgi:hypothetical protein